MDYKFKEGDQVVIRSDSQYYDVGENNPVDVYGYVIEVISDDLEEDLGIRVAWQSGKQCSCMNTYNEKDLVFFDKDSKQRDANFYRQVMLDTDVKVSHNGDLTYPILANSREGLCIHSTAPSLGIAAALILRELVKEINDE